MPTSDPPRSPECAFPACRQREILDQLAQDYDRRLRQILRLQEVVKGSVYQLTTRCGNPSCHCSKPQGGLHAATVLTWNEQGKKCIRSLASGDRERMRTLADNYRCLRHSRSALTKLHHQILQAIDRLEEALRVPPPPPVRRPHRSHVTDHPHTRPSSRITSAPREEA